MDNVDWKNEIDLFDRYIDGLLSDSDKAEFERRLSFDAAFAGDFRVYLFTVRGICMEAEQDNIEFGHAIGNMSEDELKRIIGYDRRPSVWRARWRRHGAAWAASIAALFIVGMFVTLNYTTKSSENDRIDNIIVSYNYIPGTDRAGNASASDTDRGWESITSDDIPTLEKAYRTAPADDVQAQQDAGMRLAMAYLKVHDRAKAREMLNELSVRFADDADFAAQCRKIISQIES